MKQKNFFSFCLLVAGAVLIHSVCAAAPLMVEKNIFAQDRKAPSPESAQSTTPTTPGMAVTNIQLDGVMIQGNTKKALVRLKNVPAGTNKRGQSPFVTVTEGQQIGDMRVSKIEARSISVEKDGQTFTINLFAENKVLVPPTLGVPVPQPAPAPAQPPEMGGNAPEQIPPAQMGVAQRRPAGQGFPQQMPPPNQGAPGFEDPALNQQMQQQNVQPEQAGQEPAQVEEGEQQ